MILANRINGRVSGRTKQPANATYARARARVYEIYFCLSYNFSRLILHFVKVNNNVSCAFQNAVCEIFVIYVFITRTGISGGREGGISEFFEVFSIRPSRIERYEYCAMNFWLTDSSDSSWYLPLKIVLACHMGRHKVHRSTWYPCSRFVRFAVVVSRKEKEKEEKKKKTGGEEGLEVPSRNRMSDAAFPPNARSGARHALAPMAIVDLTSDYLSLLPR